MTTSVPGLASKPGFNIKPNPAGFMGFIRAGFGSFMGVL